MDFDITFRGLIVFGVEIRFYSLMILAGLLAGIVLAQREAKRLGENPDHVLNIAVIGVIFGLIGARLYHVIDLWSFYSENPGQIFVFRAGGIGIFGAIAGAAFALVLYVWWVNRRARAGRGGRIRALRWFDIGAPAFLLGQAVGRWGNFFNTELYGPETTLPWGIPVAPGYHFPWDSGAPAYFHPLFLYESLLSLLGVIVLLWAGRRFAHRLRQGDILFLYLIWYALERSALEFLRTDNWKLLDVVPVAHIVSAAMVIVALLALLRWRRPPYLNAGAPRRSGGGAAALRSRAAERRARRRAQGELGADPHDADALEEANSLTDTDVQEAEPDMDDAQETDPDDAREPGP